MREFRARWRDTKEAIPDFMNEYGLEAINGETLIVEQFTGLLDKNGNKIFEGDIVKTETDKPMVVSWNTKFASFCLDREGWAFSHWFGESCVANKVEIIGNTTDNPELLK